MTIQRSTARRRPTPGLVLSIIFIFIGFCSPGFCQESIGMRQAEHYYRRGLSELAQGKYQVAASEFGKYLQLPHDASSLSHLEAVYYQAYSRLQLADPTALPALEQFADAHPELSLGRQAWFELGRASFRRKAWEKTIAYLGRIPTSSLDAASRGEAAFYRGYSYLSLKEFDKAEMAFDQAKQTEHNYRAAAHYYSAYLGLRRGAYDQALADLQVAERDPSLRNMVPLLRANLYYRKGDYDKVIAEARQATADSASRRPGLEDMQLLAAESYFFKGDMPQADRQYRAYQARNRAALPKVLAYHVGYAALAQRQADRAIPALTSASQVVDTSGGKADTVSQLAAYYLGQAYMQKGNQQYALNAYVQARELDAIDSVTERASLNAGLLLSSLGRYDAARITLEQFKADFPNSILEAQADEAISETYLYGQDYDVALEHFSRLRTKTPKVLAAYQRILYQKGIRLVNEGKPAEAANWLEQAVAQPQSPTVTRQARFWAGEALAADHQYDKAEKQYTALLATPGIEQTELAAPARYGLGYALFNQRLYARALPHLRQYVESKEGKQNAEFYTSALTRLADCYYATKDNARAQATYDKALAARGAEVDYLLYQKSQVASAQGKPAEAAQDLARLLQQFPSSRFRDQAQFQQAQIALDQGQYQEATAGFSRIIAAAPDGPAAPFAYLKRGVAYANLKENDKAAADYARILNDYGQSPAAEDAIVGLQEVLTANGKSDEFYPYLEKYKAANPKAGGTENLEFETAKGLYFNQKYDKAVRALETFTTSYPQSSLITEARFYLGESHYRQNDRIRSLEEHRRVVTEGRSAFLSRSVARVAEMEHTGGNYAESNRFWQQLLSISRNKKEQANALAGLADNYLELGSYDSAMAQAEQVLTLNGAPPDQQNKAQLIVGKVHYAKNEVDKAQDEFLAVMNSAKDAYGAEANYLLGELLYKDKKYDEAIAKLIDLNNNYGHLTRWKDKAFLLIADTYIAKGDRSQASATLHSIVDQSPDKKTKDAARARLETLGQSAPAAETDKE